MNDSILPSAESYTFPDCINALVGKLMSNSHGIEDLQNHFFQLANSNKTLPNTADNDLIDSFIAILVIIISRNKSYPSAIKALSILFTYLKNDNRVFKRFYPTQEVMLQLNLDKYLVSGHKEEKRLVLDFMCFLMRYYEDIDYTDIAVNHKVIMRIRKAEQERAWIDIERLIKNQEKIVKVSEQNQQMNSKAFTELFVYIEEVKKNSEESIRELNKEVSLVRKELEKRGIQVNSQGKFLSPNEAIADLIFVKNIETTLNEKVKSLQILVDKIMNEASNFGLQYGETAKELQATKKLINDTTKKTQDIINMVNLDSQLITDTKGILISRLSKIEDDILTLTTRNTPLTSNERGDSKNMVNLRIDAVRGQVDTEVMPKINELQLKMKAVELQLNVIANQGMDDSSSILLTKLNDKGFNRIAEMVKIGMDSIEKEVKGYKMFLNSLREQIANTQEALDWLKQEFHKEVDNNKKREEKQNLINEALQKNIEVRYKELEAATQKNDINASTLLSRLETEVKEMISDFNNYKSINTESSKSQLKNIVNNFKQNDEKFALHNNELNTLRLKVGALEEECLRFVRQEEDNVKYTRLEDKILRLDKFEEKAIRVIELESKLTSTNERINKLTEDYMDLKSIERTLIARIETLESRPISNIVKKDLDLIREELLKYTEHIRVQTQHSFEKSLAYTQKFTNQRALDKVKKIKSVDSNYTTKLNCLEWLLSYYEHLTPKSALSIIEAFRETVYSSRMYEKSAFAVAKHTSDIMSELSKYINDIKSPNSVQEKYNTLSNIEIYMSILELTLLNDQNIDNGLSLGILPELVRCIILLLSVYEFKQYHEKLKLTVRCLTYCFQNSRAIDLLSDLSNGITTIVSLIESFNDEEITANSIKIARVCLASDRQYDKIVQRVPSLFVTLMRVVGDKKSSEILLDEATDALKLYTRKVYVLESIDNPNVLDPLCRIVSKKSSARYREFSIEVLKNCCKEPKLLAYVKRIGVLEIIPKTNEKSND